MVAGAKRSVHRSVDKINNSNLTSELCVLLCKLCKFLGSRSSTLVLKLSF